MIDPQEQGGRVLSLPPLRTTLVRRKPEQFERMPVGIAKLESPHTAAARRQTLGSAGADRSPTGTGAQVGICPIHVGHHDRQMLEPEIVAAAVCWVGRGRRTRLHEREGLRAELQHDLPGGGAPGGVQGKVDAALDLAAADAAKCQGIAIECLGRGEVADETRQVRQAFRDAASLCAIDYGFQDRHATAPVVSLDLGFGGLAREIPWPRDRPSDLADASEHDEVGHRDRGQGNRCRNHTCGSSDSIALTVGSSGARCRILVQCRNSR